MMLKINESDISSSRPYFQKIEQVYFMFIVIPMMLFVVGLLKHTKEGVAVVPYFEFPAWLIGFVCITGLLSLVLIVINYRKIVKELRLSSEGLKSKMVLYYTISLKYYFRIEIIALFFSITYFISADKFIAMMGFFHLALIAYERATPIRLAKQLKVDKDTYNKLIKDEQL